MLAKKAPLRVTFKCSHTSQTSQTHVFANWCCMLNPKAVIDAPLSLGADIHHCHCSIRVCRHSLKTRLRSHLLYCVWVINSYKIGCPRRSVIESGSPAWQAGILSTILSPIEWWLDSCVTGNLCVCRLLFLFASLVLICRNIVLLGRLTQHYEIVFASSGTLKEFTKYHIRIYSCERLLI